MEGRKQKAESRKQKAGGRRQAAGTEEPKNRRTEELKNIFLCALG